MDDDIVSSLPEHLKHHILSLIPGIKQVARTSTLSKSWLQTWRSFPITEIHPWQIMPGEAIDDLRKTGRGNVHSERFVRLVDDALLRSRDGMPRFRLYVTFDMLRHVGRWVDLALDCRVQELSIGIFNGRFQFPVPARVLSTKFIKSLTLDGMKVDGISAVSLPSLLSLQLYGIVINEEMFQRFIGGCPLVEDLMVFRCNPLSEIELSNLNYLKRVNLRTYRPDFNVRIKAPGLERFVFSHKLTIGRLGSLVFDVSPSVTCLELTKMNQSNEWFCHLLSKFPLLESLTLELFTSLRRIRISNPLLKKISIKSCFYLEEIRIDTPKLLSFCYKNHYSIGRWTLPFIWTENTPYSSAFGLEISFAEDPLGQCLEELQKFLIRWSATFRCLESTVCLCQHGERIEEDMKKKLALSAPGIQYMIFEFFPEASQSQEIKFLILDCLFHTCRPTSVILRVPDPLLELICKAFALKEEDPDYPDCCSSAGGSLCFCHGLKDAKIERFEGTHGGRPLDWSTLCSLLPVEVRIRLRWRD